MHDIGLLNLEVYIYQQFVYQILWKGLRASYVHSHYPVKYILYYLKHDFGSTFHIAYGDKYNKKKTFEYP